MGKNKEIQEIHKISEQLTSPFSILRIPLRGRHRSSSSIGITTMKAIIRPTLISSSPSSFLSNPTTSSTACSSIISSALFSTTTPTTTTTTTATTTASLWIDTDVGFDDLVAIGCCCDIVNDNVTVNGNDNDSGSGKTIAGISTVGGGLTSNTFDGVTILRRLLFSSNDDGDDDNNGEKKFVTVPGRMKKSSKVSKIIPDPFWLTKCRSQMDDFCSSEGIILSNSINTTCGNEYEDDNTNILDDNNDNDKNRNDNVDDDDDDDAATAFLSTTMMSTTDNKIDLICLGPLTNLAHWLEYIPDFASDRLNSVWILGGNIPTIRTATTSSTSSSSSLSEEIVEAEFNFARDPEAVQTVLNHRGLHGKTIHIVPQEVCDRDAFERSFRSGVGLTESGATTAAATFSASEIIDDWLTKCNISNNTTTSVSSLLPSWMVRLIRTRSFSLYGDPICIYIRDMYLHNNDNNNNNMGNSKSDNDESNNVDAGNKTTMRWKNYYTSSSSSSSKAGNDNILEVDSHGRLLLVQQSATDMGAATTTATARTAYVPVVNDNGKHVDDESKIDCNNCNGNDYSKYEGINNNNNNNNKYNNDSHNDDNCSGVTIRVAHEVDLGPAYLDWLTKALTTTATTTTSTLL